MTWRSRARLAATGVAALLSMATIRPTAQPGAKPIDIVAERFSFTPSEIKAKLGSPVVIRLRSEDTDHGFRLLGTEIDARIPKRGKGTVTVTFEPPREGRYTFECSHVCGAGHSYMRGTIVVTK